MLPKLAFQQKVGNGWSVKLTKDIWLYQLPFGFCFQEVIARTTQVFFEQMDTDNKGILIQTKIDLLQLTLQSREYEQWDLLTTSKKMEKLLTQLIIVRTYADAHHIHWVPLRKSLVITSTRLQQADSFASILLTAMLKSSFTTSTLPQRAVFFASFFSF